MPKKTINPNTELNPNNLQRVAIEKHRSKTQPSEIPQSYSRSSYETGLQSSWQNGFDKGYEQGKISMLTKILEVSQTFTKTSQFKELLSGLMPKDLGGSTKEVKDGKEKN